MFDMWKWDEYLVEYCQNAEQDGATPCDLLELLMIQAGRLLPRIKAEEVYRANLSANLTEYAIKKLS
jgi:hypothetical protein